MMLCLEAIISNHITYLFILPTDVKTELFIIKLSLQWLLENKRVVYNYFVISVTHLVIKNRQDFKVFLKIFSILKNCNIIRVSVALDAKI